MSVLTVIGSIPGHSTLFIDVSFFKFKGPLLLLNHSDCHTISVKNMLMARERENRDIWQKKLSGTGRIRTADLQITNPTLYRLSYRGTEQLARKICKSIWNGKVLSFPLAIDETNFSFT